MGVGACDKDSHPLRLSPPYPTKDEFLSRTGEADRVDGQEIVWYVYDQVSHKLTEDIDLSAHFSPKDGRLDWVHTPGQTVSRDFDDYIRIYRY
jgi:hypothetical protein